MPDATPDADLITFRHALHQWPEPSGHEERTAQTIATALAALSPDDLITGLGGHGVAAVFRGQADGPTVMLRAELDALPIPDKAEVPHQSRIPGAGHLCGHDGHSTILLATAQALAAQRPARGRAVLLFQPAEEDGSGAAAVLADPAFAPLRPDWAFALHNMPGLPLGLAQISPGPANCASVGLRLVFTGATAHAATPQTGVSPLPAILSLIPEVQALAPGGDLGPDFRLITVTHIRAGEPAFGIAPGQAELWLTLRCLADAPMGALKAQVSELAQQAARQHGLSLASSWHDDFAACTNDPQASAHILAALRDTATPHDPAEPMRASEDFGRFGQGGTRSAMFLLGAGESHPALHDPLYDFPDALIPLGRRIFLTLTRNLLG